MHAFDGNIISWTVNFLVGPWVILSGLRHGAGGP